MSYLGESVVRTARRWIGDKLSRVSPGADLQLHSGREILLHDPTAAAGGPTETPYTLSSNDVLVMPEYLGASLAAANLKLPTVIFNQNVHGTFRGYGFAQPLPSAYLQANVLGAVVVSEHNRRYLSYAFEQLRVERVVNGVDASLFFPGDEKEERLAFMPRKMPGHIEQVLNILEHRGALEGWQLSPIDGMSEAEVAQELRRSLIYLSTCKEEGFGLPPLEAGMAGCLVVGYTGSAADEFFEAGLCTRVAQDDVLGLAEALETTLTFASTDRAAALARGHAFSEYLTARYSLVQETESVLTAWARLLGS